MSVTTRGNKKSTINAAKSDTAAEKHLPTHDERLCIEALLDCSDRAEDLVDTICCDDWAEATVGWKATVPNPKFVIQNPIPVKRRKDDDDRDEPKAGKHRSPYDGNPQRGKNGNTATYRYTTRNKTQTRPAKPVEQLSAPKRPPDAALQQHINKVKEHLEIAFKNRDHSDVSLGSQKINEKLVAEFLGDLLRSEELDKETGQSLQTFAILNAAGKTSGEVSDTSKMEVSGNGKKVDKGQQGMENGREDKQGTDPKLKDKTADDKSLASSGSDVTLIVENTRIRAMQQLCSKHEAGMKKEKELDLLDKINRRLDESLAENDQYTVRLKKKSAYTAESGKLNSRSYEKFPAFTIMPAEQGLKPLRKLTPSQRKASDDNDVMAKMLKSESEVDLRGHVASAPSAIASSGVSSSLSCTMSTDALDRYNQNSTPSPNNNFMTKGINGKSISKIPALLKNSPYAQPVVFTDRDRKKVNVRPRKVASISTPNNSEGLSPRPLGDPVMAPRHIQDRNTTTIATELLPGIDGRKMAVPLMTQRLL